MKCPHTPIYPEPHAVPSIESCMAMCTIVDDHDHLKNHPRAVTVPEGNRTFLDRAFWGKCDATQKACVLSHERALSPLRKLARPSRQTTE